MIPKIRFKNFHNPWSSYQVSEFASFRKGKSIQKADVDVNGETECILYGELYTKYEEQINSIVSKTNIPVNKLLFGNKNDVLIPASGESHLEMASASCLLKDNIAIGGDINILHSNNNGTFLSYYFNYIKKTEFASFAQGAGKIHLYAEQIKEIEVNLPCVEEQEKIAEFIAMFSKRVSELDKKINLLKEYKKGVLQKIFSQTIRFQSKSLDSEGKWENVRLKDILTPYKKLNEELYEPASIGKQGVRLRSKIFNAKFMKNSKKNKVIFKDTLTIGLGSTQIDIGVMVEDEIYSVSPAYTTYKINENFNSIFIKEYFQYLNPMLSSKFIIKSVRQGKSIDKSGLLNFRAPFPTAKEQNKIASLAKSLDKNINLNLKAKSKTEKYKLGIIQSLMI